MVDWLNARLFQLLHRKRMAGEIQRAISDFRLEPFEFRVVEKEDLVALENLLQRQEISRLRYFQPHGFALEELQSMLANVSFLMFGVFHQEKMIGYFFLRCFWNKKCFVGRLIDQPYERRGMGRVMNQIMYNIAWRSGFRCMTTISRDNASVMRSHANNPHARIVGKLANEYLLVEFVSEEVANGRFGPAD